MFIAAAMTLSAVFKILNALFQMLTANFCRRVFMAAVAGKLLEVAFDMTGFAFGIVVFIQHKEIVMFKRRGLPLFLTMALVAVIAHCHVQRVGRWCVARLALFARIVGQHFMLKMHRCFAACGADMIGMTRHAILGEQFVVEWYGRCRFLQGFTFRGQFADVVRFVTADAVLVGGAMQWRVTGKAIASQ